MGRYTTSKQGFTIIETMIYLAIAGVLFLITLLYLGDKQRQTQFTQGVREFETTLNDIANDTSTGVFTSEPNIECSRTGSTGVNRIDLDTISTGALPGENNDCVFVGNAIQLRNDGSDGATASNYFVHTLVGLNSLKDQSVVDAGGAIDSFLSVSPQPLHDSSEGIDTTQEYQIPWGVEVTQAYVAAADDSNFSPINGIAFLYSNFGESLAANSIRTGVANIALYVNEDGSARDLDDFRDSINYDDSAEPKNVESIVDQSTGVSRVVRICLQGVDGRQAMIEMGSESGSFNARADFNPTERCRNA